MSLDLKMKVTKPPTEELSLTNCAIVNPNDFAKYFEEERHVVLQTDGQYVFSLRTHVKVPPGQIGFNLVQRKWAIISIDQEVIVNPYRFDPNTQYVSQICLQVDFLKKSTFHPSGTTRDPYDTEIMAAEFVAQFAKQAFTRNQKLVFRYMDKQALELTVKEMEVASLGALKGEKVEKIKMTDIGLVLPNTVVIFKTENSSMNLVGKAKGKQVRQSIINSDWDFQKMGIGGLDNEFTAIFRKAFASRFFPPEIVEQFGCKQVSGILLYGLPGTGKTLMARQIGNMLNVREPKIVDGSQILDKYVGESEASIGKLFADAEEEEKRLGPNSSLHIIIIDVIDAICKTRRSVSGDTGVHDTVLNQLLSKIDGVDQLNNILVIGTTNRRDLIDEALLRPGRLEVQMEIDLPSQHGRCQILNICTEKMRQNDKLSPDVDIGKLATLTRNFRGAEIQGLVTAALSFAIDKRIKESSKVEIDPDWMIKMEDFLHALETDITPAFGSSDDQIDRFLSEGIILWGPQVSSVLTKAEKFVKQVNAVETEGVVSVLLEGPPNSGTTALAARIAKKSGFPFVKVCSPEDMIGYGESEKCMAIKKLFDDAHKLPVSCVIVDDIEVLLDYNAIGSRYANSVFQTLKVLLRKQPPKGRKILILGTTSMKSVLDEMELVSAFMATIHVHNLSSVDHLATVLEETDCFNREEIEQIVRKINNRRLFVPIKKLLAYIDMAKHIDRHFRVIEFLSLLEEEDVLDMK